MGSLFKRVRNRDRKRLESLLPTLGTGFRLARNEFYPRSDRARVDRSGMLLETPQGARNFPLEELEIVWVEAELEEKALGESGAVLFWICLGPFRLFGESFETADGANEMALEVGRKLGLPVQEQMQVGDLFKQQPGRRMSVTGSAPRLRNPNPRGEPVSVRTCAKCGYQTGLSEVRFCKKCGTRLA